jgi:hypothetical protein
MSLVVGVAFPSGTLIATDTRWCSVSGRHDVGGKLLLRPSPTWVSFTGNVAVMRALMEKLDAAAVWDDPEAITALVAEHGPGIVERVRKADPYYAAGFKDARSAAAMAISHKTTLGCIAADGSMFYEWGAAPAGQIRAMITWPPVFAVGDEGRTEIHQKLEHDVAHACDPIGIRRSVVSVFVSVSAADKSVSREMDCAMTMEFPDGTFGTNACRLGLEELQAMDDAGITARLMAPRDLEAYTAPFGATLPKIESRVHMRDVFSNPVFAKQVGGT